MTTTNYITLDRSFVNKFWAILDTMGRSVSKRYDNNCEKEVFVRRTLHKWFAGKYIIHISEEDTGLRTFTDKSGFNGEKITEHCRKILHISRIEYYLGYREELQVFVNDAAKSLCFMDSSFKVHHNFMLNMEFKETTKEVFNSVVSIFADDRPTKKFLFSTWNMKKYVRKNKREGTVVLEGRDWKEARESFEQVEQIYLNNMIKVIE